MWNERPGDRFDQIARRQRPFGFARPRLDRRKHRLARRLAAIERRQRHTIDADDAYHLFDHVGLALHVRPPRRRCDFNPLALAGDEEAQSFEDPAHLQQRNGETGEPLEFGHRKIDDALGRLGAAGAGGLGRSSTAKIEHHLARQLEPGQHESRIDAALKAIARVGIDARVCARFAKYLLDPTAPIRSVHRWSPPSIRSVRRP